MPLIHNDELESQAAASESTFWNYTQTFLKGIGVVAIGGLVYTFFRSLTAQASNEKDSLVIPPQRNMADAAIAENLTMTYRHKRDAVPVMDEFLANTYKLGDQSEPVAATFNNGNFIIAWQSANQASNISGSDIYAQFFTSVGTKINSEFLVNTQIDNDQTSPAIVVLTNDTFVIAWHNFDNRILAQRFASDGTKLGLDFYIDNGGAFLISKPKLAALSEGFVATWSNYYYGVYDVYCATFDNDAGATSLNFLVNLNTTNVQLDPSVAALTDNRFVIVWSGYEKLLNTNQYNIYARVLDIYLGSTDIEFLVSAYNMNGEMSPAVTALTDGGFVIVWKQLSVANSYFNVHGQRFDYSGFPVGWEIILGSNLASTYPTVLGLSNGQFIITYGDKDSSYIKIHQFSELGMIDEVTMMAPDVTMLLPSFHATAGFSNNQFAVAWQSYSQTNSESLNIYAKIYATDYILPILLKNNLAINQGQTYTFKQTNLLANSGGRTAVNNLVFLVSDLQHGSFTRNNLFTQSIVNFTQAELQSGAIQFTHDDSYIQPSYNIAIYDGVNMTAPQAALIDFFQKPQFIKNVFTIADGKNIKLSTNNLLASTNKNNVDIVFDVQAVSHGIFSLSEATFSFSNAITIFNQSHINNNQIWFIHDGSNIAPSYLIRATYMNASSNYQNGAINFISKASLNNRSTIIGASIGGTAGALLLGLGIFGGCRYKKAKENSEERAKYPLASALYRTLPIQGVADFKSTNGMAFVNAVNAIEGYLKGDTQQMIQEELDDLANKLARAIKAQVGYKKGLLGDIQLNISEIEYQAEAIAQTVQTLGGVALAMDINEVEMNPISQKSDLDKLASCLKQRGLDVNHLTSSDLAKLADALIAIVDQSSKPVISMSN